MLNMKRRAHLPVITLILISILMLTSGFRSFHSPVEQSGPILGLEQFDLLTESDGWIRMGGRIFWTQDAGQTWIELATDIQLVKQPTTQKIR